MVPLTQVNGKINMRTESRTHGAVLRRTLGCAGCGTEKPAQSSQEPRAWCHICESSPHTCSVSCTPALARLQLFPLKSSKSFGDEGWMLAILRTPLLFISCVFWNQLPRYPAWWESATASGRLQPGWSGNVIFLKTLLALLQSFLGFSHDLKTSQSPVPSPSASLALVLVLHLTTQSSQKQSPHSPNSTQTCKSELQCLQDM